jgi:hypothetical protein
MMVSAAGLPNIGLQRTARLRLAAAEAGSLGCEVELGR